MSKTTGIEWTDHTFNPWWGCEKVSPACASCYAEEWADRFPKTRGLWGPTAPRKIGSENVWREPIAWNDDAIAAGVRRRVFCASMADVFEDRRDLDEHRTRLWRLIEKTQDLIWLLLTKRPEKVLDLVPVRWRGSLGHGGAVEPDWPSNAWIGTTVEDQERARGRISHLVRIPAPMRFVSCEPLLTPLDLTSWLGSRLVPQPPASPDFVPGIDWVIAGGESGRNARPMHPDWARKLRDDCQAARVPFFFKQWGEWKPAVECYPDEDAVDESGCEIVVPDYLDTHYGDASTLALEPSGVVAQRVNADGTGSCSHQARAGSWWMAKVGKKAAGATLDGREWREFPAA